MIDGKKVMKFLVKQEYLISIWNSNPAEFADHNSPFSNKSQKSSVVFNSFSMSAKT